MQLPTATWHAYNAFGGESCYTSSHGLPGGQARKVSLLRPSSQGYGSGTFLYLEHEGVRWLEEQGYDVEYFTSPTSAVLSIAPAVMRCTSACHMRSTRQWPHWTG